MTNIYRKIYESHYGTIPKDSDGRTYEIHHIDGNHNNNEITNLQCVSIQEHYDIHYAQKDWAACLMIADRANMSPEEKSKLSSLTQKERLKNGTHHFGNNEWQSQNQLKLVEEGRHNFAGKKCS